MSGLLLFFAFDLQKTHEGINQDNFYLVLLLIFFGILFQILWEPMKVANNIWCTIIDYVRKHISKKKEDKDISNLEL